MSGRPGDDLLSRALRQSTIGATGFHGRVRNGIGWDTCAITTGSSRHMYASTSQVHNRIERVIQTTEAKNKEDIQNLSVSLQILPCVGVCLYARLIKPIERLVPISFTHYCASTLGLSTWWSPTVLKRILVLRGASRLDAFSGYPCLLYTSPSPRDKRQSRMPSSA